MKVYITKFFHDDKEYSGPNIYAESEEDASLIAEGEGYEVVGELTDIIALRSTEEKRTIH
mgnify:FL=1|jgi:hypothetical protein|tara:strand:- start:185 stop:364 length:180 start_codon:yes stop_codon:yes gene_type:complete